MRRIALFLALALLASTASAEPVRVVMHEADDVQSMAFWIAKSRGFFAEEGVDVALTIPPNQKDTSALLVDGAHDAAILAPQLTMDLISKKAPILVIANLFENDPGNIILSASYAKDHPVRGDETIEGRLARMKGLRVAVAPGPQRRLEAMLRARGLPSDFVTISAMPNKDQIAALDDKKVDALFATSPITERAIVERGAVLLLHISAGEIKELSGMQVFVLAVTKELRDRSPKSVQGLATAIARAEKLLHEDERAAIDALGTALPNVPKDRIAMAVSLYKNAVPKTPLVSVAAQRAWLSLFTPPPGLQRDAGLPDLAPFIDGSFTGGAPSPSATTDVGSAPVIKPVPVAEPRTWEPVMWVFGVAFATLLAIMVFARAKKADS